PYFHSLSYFTSPYRLRGFHIEEVHPVGLEPDGNDIAVFIGTPFCEFANDNLVSVHFAVNESVHTQIFVVVNAELYGTVPCNVLRASTQNYVLALVIFEQVLLSFVERIFKIVADKLAALYPSVEHIHRGKAYERRNEGIC